MVLAGSWVLCTLVLSALKGGGVSTTPTMILEFALRWFKIISSGSPARAWDWYHLCAIGG